MNSNDKYSKNELIIIYLISSFIGIATVFLAMLLASIISVVFEINLIYLSTISSICLAIGSFFAGYFSGKKIKYGGIVNGLIVSLIIFLFVFLISLIINPTAITFITLIHLVITILSAVIGGIFGVNNTKKH